MLSLIQLVGLALFQTVTLASELEWSESLLVTTTSGRVYGFRDTNTTTVSLQKWYGLRYAQDTSGPNRWNPPKPYSDTINVFNASSFGPACLQGRADGGSGTSDQSEDCLRLNIVSPTGASNLPVYVYSHGGGFDSGASSDAKLDGSFHASRGIVFVSYNYRLSLWGWPHSSEIAQAGQTQNLGLLDTRAAVEWVRDNIASFGGDPKKITLGGESVGGEMTNLYLSAFPTDPIIRGAIMQSGDTSQPQWQPNSQLDLIAKNVSCPMGKGQLDCLREKDGNLLRNVLLYTGAQFQPVIDNITVYKDYVKQTREGQTARVPLLIGTNKDEGGLIVNGEPTAYTNASAYLSSNNLNFPFVDKEKVLAFYPAPSEMYPSIYNATSAMWRDAHMLCLASNLGNWRTAALGLPVWRYRFDLVADNLNSRGSAIGAFHGSDIRFVMGTTNLIATSPPYVPVTPFQQNVSNYMVEAWTNFVKGRADPSKGPNISGWKKYNPNDTTTLAILGISESGPIEGDHLEADKACSYWNTILPIYPQTFPLCGTWNC